MKNAYEIKNELENEMKALKNARLELIYNELLAQIKTEGFYSRLNRNVTEEMNAVLVDLVITHKREVIAALRKRTESKEVVNYRNPHFLSLLKPLVARKLNKYIIASGVFSE